METKRRALDNNIPLSGSPLSGLFGKGGGHVVILLLFVMVFLNSCGSPFTQVNSFARESFKDEEFRGMAHATVGILTATGAERAGNEYKRLLVEFVEMVLKKERPDILIIPYWETLGVINEAGLSDEYARMIGDYTVTGILHKDILKRLGRAAGVKYFIQPRLVTFSKGASGRFGAGGLSILKTYDTSIKVYCELWDIETGQIVWVGVGEAQMIREHYKAKPIPFEDVALEAITKLVSQFPETEEIKELYRKKELIK